MKSMKSSGFHHEIWQISWNLADFRWNQMFQKSDADVSAKTLLIGPLKVERPILDHHTKAHIPWNLADFMKSDGFHEIQWISYRFHMDFIWISLKLADFIWISPWNLVDFTMKSSEFHEINEIQQISGEIQWISPRYHLWNPPKIIKASVSAKTL